MKVLIIIPAYNEEQNIEKTVNDVKTNTNYDYVVINDCSKDKTKEVCEKNNFNMLSLPINYGLTSGIQLGMKYAIKIIMILLFSLMVMDNIRQSF